MSVNFRYAVGIRSALRGTVKSRPTPRPVLCNRIDDFLKHIFLSIQGYGTSVAVAGDKACREGAPSPIGQPTSASHPHLLKPGEICTGITKSEITNRRTYLMHSIQKHKMTLDMKLTNHTVVIPSANKKYMSDKIPYDFRQNSDFYYLTGCLEPESTLVLHIGESDVKSVLFMRPKDRHSELWDGVRTGPGLAPEYFGCDESYSTDGIGKYLADYLDRSPNSILWYDKNNVEQPNIVKAVQASQQFALNKAIESPIPLIHKMRVFKSPAEMNLMRRTCAIAAEAINQTVASSQPGDSEYLLYANVDYRCRVHTAKLAYPPVVAGGRNATTIHYIDNNQLVADGDMVLMDAGCEYGGYSSDITRTWPINGRFTDAQLVLYEVTLNLQRDLIEMLGQTGAQTLDDLFDTMCYKLGVYLQEAGLVNKSLSGMELARVSCSIQLALIKFIKLFPFQAAYSFCPHHVSHYLGMDVHDTPTYSRSNPLSPGMVFTVEPGIYISHNRRNVPEEFRGLGIRIEDDCAVLEDSSVEVLTRDCVKDVQGINELKVKKSF